MATVLPAQDKFAGLRNLGLGAIQGLNQGIQRNQLTQGLSPEQRQATQGLPLTQLTNLVTGLAQNQFLSPLQKSQQANQAILSNGQGSFLQGLGGANFGNLSNEQALQGSRLGLFPTPQQPRQLTEFESNIQGFSPEEQGRARRVRAGIAPRPSTTGTTAPVTFDTDFTDESGKRVRDTTTVRVPKGFEAQAQDLGNKYGTLNPVEIFASQADNAAESAGLISFNGDGALIIDVQETKVDTNEITPVFPDIAKAALVKGVNPVDAIQSAFKEWDSFTFEDKGEGAFNVKDNVSLSSAAPKPSEEEQAQLILNSVFPLLDEQTQADLESQFESLDTAGVIKLLKGAFQKGRPRR